MLEPTEFIDEAKKQGRRRALRVLQSPMESGVASAVAVVELLHEASDSLVAELRRVEPRELRPACARGCTWCCYGGRVDVSAPEAIAIAEHLRGTLSGEALVDVRSKLEEQSAVVNDRGTRATWEARTPCPFLDTTRAECIVYELRPMGCRAWTSMDVAACEASFHAGGSADPDVPTHGLQIAMCRNVDIGAGETWKAQGLEAAMFEVATAVLAVLDDPGIGESWAARQPMPQSAHVMSGARLRPKPVTADEKRTERNRRKQKRRKLKR